MSQGKSPGTEDYLVRRGTTPGAESTHTGKGKTRKTLTNGDTRKGTPKDQKRKHTRRVGRAGQTAPCHQVAPVDAVVYILNIAKGEDERDYDDPTEHKEANQSKRT